jgi:cytochrome P450
MSDTTVLDEQLAQFFAQPGQPDLLPMYRELLEHPVHRAPNGTWIVSSHALGRTVVTSKQFMRSGQGGYGLGAVDSAARKMWALAIVNLDEPDHTRLRSLATQAFSNRAVELLREKAEKVVAQRIADLAPRGTMDVIS